MAEQCVPIVQCLCECLTFFYCSKSETELYCENCRALKASSNNKTQSPSPSPENKGKFIHNNDQKSWQDMYGRLVEYKQINGDCLVPYKYQDDKQKLGHWVFSQRQSKKNGKLTTDRQRQLDDIEFVWDASHMKHKSKKSKSSNTSVVVDDASHMKHNKKANNSTGTSSSVVVIKNKGPAAIAARNDKKWQSMYQRLVEYKQVHGDCLVPSNSKEDESLGKWVIAQRRSKKTNRITSDRQRQLDDIGFVWDATGSWDDMYETLVRYRQTHGDCLVPRSYQDDYQLGIWVFTQRQSKRNGRLTTDRQRQLDDIDFVWDASKMKGPPRNDKKWQSMYERLVEYKQTHGDCLVQKKQGSDDNDYHQFANWIANQRTFKRKGILSTERINKLEEIGFVWKIRNRTIPSNNASSCWNVMYEKLVKFKQTNGHCLVTQRYEDDKQLGQWTKNQRLNKKRGTMSTETQARLEEIGFVWAMRDTSFWDEMYERLVKYKQTYGHCLVPRDYSDKQLYPWINNQRSSKKKGTLTLDRQRQLDSIGFVWFVGKGNRKKSEVTEKVKKKLQDAMSRSEQTQKDMQLFDKEHGLRKNHSPSVVYTSQSRKQLQTGEVIYTGKSKKPLTATVRATKNNMSPPERLIHGKFNNNENDSSSSSSIFGAPAATTKVVPFWDEMYERLVKYKQKYGHCLVPQTYSDDKQLGIWVKTQRQNKKRKGHRLTTDRLRRLEEIGFAWGVTKEQRCNHNQHTQHLNGFPINAATTGGGGGSSSSSVASDGPVVADDSAGRQNEEEGNISITARTEQTTTKKRKLFSSSSSIANDSAAAAATVSTATTGAEENSKAKRMKSLRKQNNQNRTPNASAASNTDRTTTTRVERTDAATKQNRSTRFLDLSANDDEINDMIVSCFKR